MTEASRIHVGFGNFFQNVGGDRSDRTVWRAEMELADRAEALGYDSVWTVEHHFTDYTISPNPLQFLTWVAARTSRVKLGSMVCVLPWHDPVRLAEEVSVVDHLSNGRLILGIGRGLARVEFEGFGVDMAESRRLFVERADAILGAFDTGVISPGGRSGAGAQVAIRPEPLMPLRGRTYASSISPGSREIMARLGVGLMVFPQKRWERTAADVESYRSTFREVNGAEPPKPLIVVMPACDTDRHRAEALLEHVSEYYASSTDHYEFGQAALARVPGYEYYGRIAQQIAEHGREGFEAFLTQLQPHGTPEEVAEQIAASVTLIDARGVIAVCSYGRMELDAARRNQMLFATQVMPILRSLDTGAEIGAHRDGLHAHA